MESLEKRMAEDIMSDNASLHPYNQCKTCKFKEKAVVMGVDYGYRKGSCEIYEYPDFKPNAIMLNQEKCEFKEFE